MTLEEARKVAAICETADGGCGHCVNSLRELLQADFPEFEWDGEDYSSRIVVKERP